MNINASWEKSAGQYVDMYRYGLLVKKWRKERNKLIDKFTQSLKTDHELFAHFFMPGQNEYSDPFDWELKERL